MPYFSLETNKQIDETVHQTLLKEISVFISKLTGKPESLVMVQIRSNLPLIFGGSSDRAAFVQLKSIGLAEDRCSEFSKKICDFVEQELRIPKNRVFIEFKDLQPNLFGWDGKTF